MYKRLFGDPLTSRSGQRRFWYRRDHRSALL